MSIRNWTHFVISGSLGLAIAAGCGAAPDEAKPAVDHETASEAVETSTAALAGCGNACTQCVLDRRADILPFYQQNGWDTSCGNHDAIVGNWCSIDPPGCTTVKSGVCQGACSCGSPCTQCILNQRPDIVPFYQQNGWDVSCSNRDAIVGNWCSTNVDPSACANLRAGTCVSTCGFRGYEIRSETLSSGSMSILRQLSSGRRQHLSLTPEAGSALDLDLLDPSGQVIGRSARIADATDVVMTTTAQAGTFQARIRHVSGPGKFVLAWVDLNPADHHIRANVAIDATTRTLNPDYLRQTYQQLREATIAYRANDLTSAFLVESLSKAAEGAVHCDDLRPVNHVRIVINQGGSCAGFRDDIWRIGHNWSMGGVFSLMGRRALQHELGHLRASHDLYTDSGSFSEMMSYPYDTDYIEAGTRDVIRYSARKSRQQYGDVAPLGVDTPGVPITEQDRRMYWYADVAAGRPVTVQLRNIPVGANFDLFVREKLNPTPTLNNGAGVKTGNLPETVKFTPSWPRILILVRGTSGSGSYTLRVDQ